MGSPPRVRSRPYVACENNRGGGITSACAEQTGSSDRTGNAWWDHLRVCGADNSVQPYPAALLGSPPRVRSRLSRSGSAVLITGITSACAEQTRALPTPRRWPRDHLRVCGADETTPATGYTPVGSPPRVRSRPLVPAQSQNGGRITSACAEQTRRLLSGDRVPRDHLRVCGADSCILLCSEPAEWRGIFDLRTA